MKQILILLVFSLIIFSCNNKTEKDIDILNYVDPFIGTGGHGHTYPGATSPFGMVQLSPDTRLDGWDGCSGYHYTDSIIYGFSHTHLSGTGVSDYGDILLMPISGKAEYKNTNYASPFSHNNETAKAGYYSVKLDNHNILAELSTSTRTGMHKYTFASASDNKIIIDLKHRDIVLNSYLEQVNDSTIKGFRISQAWAMKQSIFFYMQFSQKISLIEISSKDSILSAKTYQSTDIVASIQFDEIKDKELLIKVGISAVDMEGAKKNLIAENKDWDFDKFTKQNQENWRKELTKIEVTDQNRSRKTVFYTSLYHNLIVPNMFSDVDGRYRGMDLKIHKSKTNQYTIFSLWDTFRATHPLYTIIDTKRTAEFISTFKNQFNDGGILPIWELAGNYTGCMIGYHAIPVIADAYLKGITDIPVDTLLKMMIKSANQDKHGLKDYKSCGYIAVNEDAESVSKTLEYAFDDWCIAEVAKHAGKDSIYKVFTKRAQSYKNILDTEIGYMRPKLNQIWKEPFDPSEVDFNYTEANSWQYSFFVPQDIYGFMHLLGGKERFEKQLDDLFTASSQTTGRTQSDITGLIGQYAHGNEPSHHMAYLYNYVNKPEKTQLYVQRIIEELYTDQPDGLCGNEDCGQMSAWYVFSAMGFYPVNPSNGEFVFGKPLFEQCKINLENGKSFIIKKSGNTGDNSKIKEIKLNNKVYTKSFITYKDVMDGGKLEFIMSSTDQISYQDSDYPNSTITENRILAVPAILSAKRAFRDSTVVTMSSADKSKIYYSLNNSNEILYTEPFTIYNGSSISMYAKTEELKSKIVKAEFYKIPEGRTINIQSTWHKQYSAGGKDALIDGLKGTNNFHTGAWQGYQFEDFNAVIDLGTKQKVEKIGINFVQDARAWIFMPEYIEYYGSTDSLSFFLLAKVKNNISKEYMNVVIENFEATIKPKNIRYLKIFAKNHNICPDSHWAAGEKGYIFLDEITIN